MIVTVAKIQEVVAEQYNLKLSDLSSSERTSRCVEPRMIAMYLASVLTRQSSTAIGRLFNRDHSTVCHAVKKIKASLENGVKTRNVVLRDAVEMLTAIITEQKSEDKNLIEQVEVKIAVIHRELAFMQAILERAKMGIKQ